MKCPHCDYEHGWSNEADADMKGRHGAFYQLPIKVERRDSFYEDRKDVYACPSCAKTFID